MSDSHQDLAFAVALRRARERLHVSQADLARVLGIPQGAVSRFECTSMSARESTVKRYAAGLGYRVELRLIPLDGEHVGDE